MGVMCVLGEGGAKMPRELSYNDYVRRLSMEATRWLYVNDLAPSFVRQIESGWKSIHDALLLNDQIYLVSEITPSYEYLAPVIFTDIKCYLDNRYGGGGYFLMGGKKHSFKDLFWIKLHD